MVDIPLSLIDAIKEQRVVLFLGAGASRGATHPDQHVLPQGDNLRDLISKKFLGGALKDKQLTFVAAMAASEVGLAQFQTYIRDLFEPYGPADFHLLIPSFRWRAIATTNFDTIIEKAYKNVPKRQQNLVKTVKDGDDLDQRLNAESNPVRFYKLHGCIQHYADFDIPFVLGVDQYVVHDKKRKLLYDQFKCLGNEYPIVFVGYSISDPHIRQILFDLTDPNIIRPPYYLVSPNINDIEQRYWSSHRVTSLKATFEDFLKEINGLIPQLARGIQVGVGGGQLSIRKHYCVAQPTEPLSIKEYLSTDATHVHAELKAPQQDPVKFYRGIDDGWGCIIQDLDVRRSFLDSVLVDAVLISDEGRRTTELYMLKGPGGNGKSIALKRIAWEASINYDQLVIYSESPAGLRIDPLSDIYHLTQNRIFLFIDHVALVRNELRDLLRASRERSIPLTVIGAERDNEWNIYCEQLEPFLCQEFPVRYLNMREIEGLLDLLEQHKALGFLKDKTPEDRVHAFTSRAERQLLVALHEATLGIAFEEIVVDEFERIEPEIARDLYLTICAFHQFGAPVRAGLISRISGVRFEDFCSDFMSPLENIVRVRTDAHSGDYYYHSRHQHVAEIVFNRVLPSAEDKFDLLSRILGDINISYASDRETFSRLIKGKRIAEIFPSTELGRLFYDRVQEVVSDEAFVFHQCAVFEMRHYDGSLELAEEAAARAHALNPDSRSIQHTQAEILRRQANEARDSLRKQALRRDARQKLDESSARLSEYDLNTRACLAIDEFKEVSNSSHEQEDKSRDRVLLEKTKEIESVIQAGLQAFPESSTLLATEAKFRDLLDQNMRAQQILERAFNLNPRQDWLAVRLARKYKQLGDLSKSKEVLYTCLQNNTNSQKAHLELGRVLSETGDHTNALEHLRRSFVEGDHRYEAQFWCAREMFLQRDFVQSEKLFSVLNDQAPGCFRTHPTAFVKEDGIKIVYDCLIVRKEEGYAFLNFPDFPKDIFASRAESNQEEWDFLQRNTQARCFLAFNRRGPQAMSIHLP